MLLTENEKFCLIARIIEMSRDKYIVYFFKRKCDGLEIPFNKLSKHKQPRDTEKAIKIHKTLMEME